VSKKPSGFAIVTATKIYNISTIFIGNDRDDQVFAEAGLTYDIETQKNKFAVK